MCRFVVKCIVFFIMVNLLICSVNTELKHKTTGSHASVSGPHGCSCPTRELEIEMNYVYSIVIHFPPWPGDRIASRLVLDDTDVC